MPLSICGIFRNEAPYLREWIEFHRVVGVGRFYLYLNNSEDDWERLLRPYVDTGAVEVTDWPMAPPAQVPAYQHFIDRHKGRDEWVAFIDCDEFLFSPRSETVGEVLGREPFANWGAMAAHWMCFGASGQEQRDDRPVIERFTWRRRDDFEYNHYVKSIVRMDQVESAGPDGHRFNVRGGTFLEDGRTLTNPFSSPPSHEWLRVNHYATKSRQEFLKRIAHGRVDQPCSRHPNEFDLYQSRDVDDRTIWRFLPELKRRLEKAPAKAPLCCSTMPENPSGTLA